MANENDSKLVNLADLAEAYNDLDDKIDEKLNSDFSSLSTAYAPYGGNEQIALYSGGANYVTTINELLSAAGGGGGTSQGALVNYVKNCGTISSLPQTFSDTNIVSNMIVLESTLTNPAAQTGDWTVTTNDGSVTISGSISGSTGVTLYFGVGMSEAPSIRTNLSATTTANILNTTVRPGVEGVLGLSNGGTGQNASSAADLRSKLGITPASIGLSATVNLNDCSSIAEIRQALINGNSLEGQAQVGRNTTNNFKTLVGDPNTGSSSAIAFVTIEAQNDNYAVMHCIVTGNNGTKHKYIFSNLKYPSNNKQTEWENVNLTLQNLGAINGTWTPVDTSLTTLSENTGRYYKIGNLVYLWAKFKVSQSIANGGIITLSGIPSAVQPTLDTQTVGTAANINQGKPLYCRAYADTSTSIGVISIANNTGAALNANGVYIVNVVFYRD